MVITSRFVTGSCETAKGRPLTGAKKNSETETMEKRRDPRTVLHHFFFDTSDGSRFYQGAIFDISRNGICMTNLPRMAGGAARIMSVIVAGPRQRFKMQVTPKWTMDKGCGKTIGAEIVSPPPGWAELVIGFEPKNDP